MGKRSSVCLAAHNASRSNLAAYNNTSQDPYNSLVYRDIQIWPLCWKTPWGLRKTVALTLVFKVREDWNFLLPHENQWDHGHRFSICSVVSSIHIYTLLPWTMVFCTGGWELSVAFGNTAVFRPPTWTASGLSCTRKDSCLSSFHVHCIHKHPLNLQEFPAYIPCIELVNNNSTNLL